MKQRCLIIMFCVILFTGCMSANPITANSDDVKSSVSLNEDDVTNLIMIDEFLERYYSGFYYSPAEYNSIPNDSAYIYNEREYYRFDVNSSEVENSKFAVIGFEYPVCSNLSELKSFIEKYLSKEYADKNLYRLYDELYYDNAGQLLYSFDSALVFALKLDYDSLEFDPDRNAALIHGEYGENNDDIVVYYYFIFDNGYWKINDKVIQQYALS